MSRGFDRVVILLTRTQTEDALGTPVETWTEAQTVRAKVHKGSGAERRAAAQEQSSLPATFTVRQSALTKAVTPASHRLRFEGKDWDIETAMQSERRGREVIWTATARIS